MRSFVILCALLAGACGHGDGDIDETVGNACTSDRQCDDKCFLGGDFPGGFCSRSCQSDNDCTGDTYCMEEAGGVCMFTCPAFDCARLGPNWHCEQKKRQNGGEVSVCAGG